MNAVCEWKRGHFRLCDDIVYAVNMGNHLLQSSERCVLMGYVSFPISEYVLVHVLISGDIGCIRASVRGLGNHLVPASESSKRVDVPSSSAL